MGKIERDNGKDGVESDGSRVDVDDKPAVTARNVTPISGVNLLTPRMRAEQIVVESLKDIPGVIEYILAVRADSEVSVAQSMIFKEQRMFTMYLLDAANNIGDNNKSAAGSGMQLSAANVVPGALAMQLAQRLAQKRNANAVPRRVVDVVSESTAVQPTAAEATGCNDVEADGGKPSS